MDKRRCIGRGNTRKGVRSALGRGSDRKGEMGIGLFRLCRRNSKWSDIVFVSAQGASLAGGYSALFASEQRKPF